MPNKSEKKLDRMRERVNLHDLPDSADEFFRNTDFGSIKKMSTNSLYGFNNVDVNPVVTQDKTSRGMVFFVRPQLNMLTENLVHSRLTYPLITKQPMSIGRFIRNTLDPRLGLGYNPMSDKSIPDPRYAIESPLVDNAQAFIPILSNNLINLSGFPDIEIPTYTSSENMYKGAYTAVDGVDNLYSTQDLNVSFRSSISSPIMNLIRIWSLIPSLYLHSKLRPYPDYIIGGVKDYETRVFRLALDSTNTYVEYIAATGPAIWTASGLGSILDYSSEEKYNNLNKSHDYRLTSQGVRIMDPILLEQFNSTVQYFNPRMRDKYREREMVRVPRDLYNQFNYRGYPFIDLRTNKFDWWVGKSYFKNVVHTMPDVILDNGVF